MTEGPDGKAGDHGIKMMFVKYPPDLESDSIRMCDPATSGIVITHDVTLMKQLYFEPPKHKYFKIEPWPIGMEVEDLGVDDTKGKTLVATSNDGQQ